MNEKYAALREAFKAAEVHMDEARFALDATEKVAVRPERRAVDEAYACWEQAQADLEAALVADCPFKVGEVYRSRTGVVATVVSHNVDIKTKSVTTWGGVHKKDGKMGVKRIILWKNEWSDAVKLGTEVAA